MLPNAARQSIRGPAVHPDLSSFAALSASDEDSTAGTIEIALLEGERLADLRPARQASTINARSRLPSASSPTVRMTATISSTVGGSAGYCAFVAWRSASLIARHGRG